MDASAYALAQGIRSTRRAIASWRQQPWPTLRIWLAASLGVAALLLLAIWVIATVFANSAAGAQPTQPPFVVGGLADLGDIFGHNLLVLAFHAMACVAGFIAGSSLPLQAKQHTGLTRLIHERGRPVALGFVVCATAFSLSVQADAIGTGLAQVSSALHASAGLVLLGLIPHALPELVALFLPLAAWVMASRRGEWDSLLAATMATVVLAIPVLIGTALWEVYAAPHLLTAVLGHG